MKYLTNCLLSKSMLLVWMLFYCGSVAFAQNLETEPNDTCLEAQDIGRISLPFTLTGSLDPSPTTGDVDFYRFSGSPAAPLRVDLEGSATGLGTLPDPFLGLFDSRCNLLKFNDDRGTLNSRLSFIIPVDGNFIVAASSCCDSSFTGTGGSSGSYQLTITQLPPAVGSISGLLIDADSGVPLAGDISPFGFVQLFHCDGGGCLELINNQSSDNTGRFHFESDFFGDFLPSGTYQVQAFANGYETAQTALFDVADGESLDVGDIALVAIPTIGSISGQLIDALTGEPIPGDVPPFASVQLFRCSDSGCFEFVTFLPVDSNGNFRIERDFAGLPLPVGVYQVEAFATDYDFARSNSFAVRDGENADIGVVVLSRPPLQLSDMQPCANIPAAGGKCRYSVTITNRTAETIKGQVWSLVNAFAIGSRFGSTMFQTDEAKKIRIAPAASKVVYFTFKVPEKVTPGTSICADLWIGKSPRAFFDTLAQLPLFCIQKEFSGAFRIMPQTGAPDMTEPSRRQSPQAASLAERKEQLLRQLRNKTR